MNYHKIEKTSVANGPGVRCTLWISGCRIGCKGCHNPETWDFNGGKSFDDEAKQELFDALSPDYIQGITFSGGHPLEPENILDVALLIREIREKLPSKDIWLYTGYKMPSDLKAPIWSYVQDCDVVVDGPYIEEERDITLLFRGSRNQRLIDIKATKEAGKIKLYE